jgi:glutamate 5-kinase
MSAIGQSVLMQAYREAFSPLGIQVAQILLAPEDTHNRVKYLNARNTFEALLQLGVLPVVNENDSVAVEEIKFGDNDRLSALVASLIDADLLVILSDVEGLFTADPRLVPQATLVEEVRKINGEIEEMAGEKGNYFSAGGMKSKIIAARMATLSGIGVIIASGKDFSILHEIGEGKRRGTFFWPEKKHLSEEKDGLLLL